MNCPNLIYKYIKDNLRKCYEQSEYKSKQKDSKRKIYGWVNDKIKNMCKKRDELYTIWLKDTSNKKIRLEYKKIRNQTNKLVHKYRNKYYKQEINKYKCDTKMLWKLINSMAGRINNSVDSIVKKAFSTDTDKTIADNFAKEFQKNVKSIIPTCSKKLLSESEYENQVDKTIFYKTATDTKVLKILRKINSNKAPGVDGIRAVDIKRLSDRIVSAIARLINACVSTGTYPKELKTGIVRPIHKGGSVSDYGKYRPITILPVIDKIVEKYIGGMIQDFYQSHNVLSPTQYGFQPKKSTTQLLSRFTDDINTCLNDKKHVLLVFIDYSKAFDTLRHDLLIKKLENSGVRGALLNWCKDYLVGRSYLVRVGADLSDPVSVTEGTAQGSVLGPLHYLAYVNDMNNIIKHCTMYQFADDTCLIAADRDISKAQHQLQADFTAICKWSHDSGLVLNADKTKMLHIRSSHNYCSKDVEILAHSHDCLHMPTDNDIKMCTADCLKLQRVHEQTYLGLVIDDRFNWAKHVNKVCDKLRAILANFYIIKNRVTFPVLLTMYKALVESIVSYGLSSYGRTFKTYVEQIYNLQYRLLKLIVPRKIKQKYKNNPMGLFKYCEVLPIQDKIDFCLLNEQFFRTEIQNDIKYTIITKSMTKKKLVIPTFRNFYGKRTSQYLIPYLINNLPSEIRTKITPVNIKRVLQNYYLNKLH